MRDGHFNASRSDSVGLVGIRGWMMGGDRTRYRVHEDVGFDGRLGTGPLSGLTGL